MDGFCERENPNLKWMMTGGTPMTQETIIESPETMYDPERPLKGIFRLTRQNLGTIGFSHLFP